MHRTDPSPQPIIICTKKLTRLIPKNLVLELLSWKCWWRHFWLAQFWPCIHLEPVRVAIITTLTIPLIRCRVTCLTPFIRHRRGWSLRGGMLGKIYAYNKFGLRRQEEKLWLVTVKQYLRGGRWCWSWHISKAAHQGFIIPSTNAYRRSGLWRLCLCQVQGPQWWASMSRLLHYGDPCRIMEEVDINKHPHKTEVSGKKEKSPDREQWEWLIVGRWNTCLAFVRAKAVTLCLCRNVSWCLLVWTRMTLS